MTQPVALITGSGRRRVGNVVAEALAARGYAVGLHYNSSAADAAETVERLRRAGARCESYGADVTQEDQVESMFDRLLQSFGRLDVLVTCAAVWQPKPLLETTAAEVRRQFDINAVGTFLCCQRAGAIMVEQPAGGLIVTLGDWATRRPYPQYVAYMMSKGAIPTLTRALAVELAERNPAVRVNCILPGPVMLPENLTQPEVQGAVAGTLLKRPGRPENIAQAVLSFIDNDYLTGVCLPVDGGRTIAGTK
jgi:pteridine reductase